ncbi:MAG: helix-hairpin-helix domain-containing protein, partial [Myxococcota bacterium]
VPDEVITAVEVDDAPLLGEWLSGVRGRKVKLIFPRRGTRTRLLDLANKNAAASAVARRNRDQDTSAVLTKLHERLSLKRMPRRIECYDIAHIQGSATVASMVVFIDGVAERSLYRKFKIKSVANDDFAAMYEVLTRRFKRSLSASQADSAADAEDPWRAPDLLVVDGGKGQLNQALTALADLGIAITAEKGFDVIGLAKERDDSSGTTQPDRVFLRNRKEPIRLRPNTTELFLLSRIRDEAHRFANTFHRQQRKRSTLRSTLDDIPGIGAKRRKLLLRHFGSLKAIKNASLDELAELPGMSRTAAQAVREHFDHQRG